MEIVILDGCAAGDPFSGLLLDLTRKHGFAVRHFALSSLSMAPCTGDFDCWMRTPGSCRSRDAGQDIACAMRHAGLVVLLTPVVSGGYSAALKKAIDRLIGLIHPFFSERDGLTRHHPRYQNYPPMLFLGVGDDVEAAATFHEYAGGNAINLIAPRYLSRVIAPASANWQDELASALHAALDINAGDRFPVPLPDALMQVCTPEQTAVSEPPESAVIFIGSARAKGCSTSEALALTLSASLEASGTRCSLVHAKAFIKPGDAADQALDTMLGAPLLIVAAPLYVDGLPYLVVSALEQLAQRLDIDRAGQRLNQLVALLNCGYPEAIHNRIAIRQLRHFAAQQGLAWRGGLALGGGELIHGRPLKKHRFLFRRPIRALTLAGAALARGQAIPVAAIELLARPLMPAPVFRWMSRVYWIWKARSNGISRKDLDFKPHPEKL